MAPPQDLDADADTPHRRSTISRWRISSAGCRRSALLQVPARRAAATRRWHTGDRPRPVVPTRCASSISRSCPPASATLAIRRRRQRLDGYTPLDLVMAAHGCDLDTAFKFLSDHTGWAGEPIVLEVPGAGADASRGCGAGVRHNGEGTRGYASTRRHTCT